MTAWSAISEEGIISHRSLDISHLPFVLDALRAAFMDTQALPHTGTDWTISNSSLDIYHLPFVLDALRGIYGYPGATAHRY